LEDLIRACALFREQVSHFHCLVVGEGEERENLQRLIAQLGLCHTVQLLGTRPQDEVTALLAEADLLVLPSVVASNGQMEGIPVALMEAMASRLPVVATRLSGIPELVEHGVTGLLVPPRDERALADAMALLYERQNLRQELGERGREKVAAEYDLAHNVAKLHSLFHTTCDRMGKEHELSSSSFANLDATLQLERQLSERISEKAVKYVPDFGGKDCPIDAHLIRRGACHDSEVYEVILEKEERHRRRLILKLHRPHWANPEEMVEQARTYAQREYKALSFLWHEFSRRSTRFAVPKPLDYFPEYAALVLEKCQGETLDQALRWARLLRTKAGRDRLYQQAEACGEWLATFHRATRQEGNPSECYQRIRQDFHNELKTCSELGLDPGLASRVATWFDRKEKLVFTGEHAIVGRHCDFGPYNAFFSRDKITVIDFEGLQAGISYDDLCYFLGMVESMPFYHLGPTLTHRIKKSFLEGYSRHEHVDRGQLDVFMLAAMVKIMAHSPVLRTRDGWRNRWKWHQRLASYRSWFGERVS
ncbi:MAG: glycosyltransferase, partial [Acidobacteriota bacterium]